MRKRRRRKCRHCSQLYHPDARSAERQHYCSAPDCKRASKRAAQQRWRAKPENQDYFKGPDQVARVRRWREAHPGYWRRRPVKEKPLQDDCPAQPAENQQDKEELATVALQDDLLSQPVVMFGLIAHLTGITLQEDIVAMLRKYQVRGRAILGKVPGTRPKEGTDETQKNPASRPPAPAACAVQLG